MVITLSEEDYRDLVNLLHAGYVSAQIARIGEVDAVPEYTEERLYRLFKPIDYSEDE